MLYISFFGRNGNLFTNNSKKKDFVLDFQKLKFPNTTWSSPSDKVISEELEKFEDFFQEMVIGILGNLMIDYKTLEADENVEKLTQIEKGFSIQFRANFAKAKEENPSNFCWPIFAQNVFDSLPMKIARDCPLYDAIIFRARLSFFLLNTKFGLASNLLQICNVTIQSLFLSSIIFFYPWHMDGF